MKIVIDIPEEVKHKVYAYGLSLCPNDKKQLINAIRNGTPLPDKHGRLIDGDALMKSNQEYLIANPIDEVEEIRNSMVIWINDDIYDAPTIIEAERGDTE